MRLITATLVGLTLLVASCGDDDSDSESVGDDVGTDDAASPDDETSSDDEAGADADGLRAEDIDPCSLLTDAELTSVLGAAPVAEESEPAGPFTGCSWGTGDVIVSIAVSDTVILAPGEDECPTADLGQESYACEGRIKFLVDGVHVTVSTVDPFFDDAQLLELARMVAPKLAG